MKKLFVLLLMSLFVVSASFAQINKNWDGTKPEVYKGSKNFVFIYSPFGTMNSFGSVPAGTYTTPSDSLDNGSGAVQYGVGFQYYVTNEIALALGFGFGSSSWEPTLTNSVRTASQSILGFAIDGNYHFKSLYSVSPYLGLNVNYGMYSNTYNETPTGGTLSTTKRTGSALGFGVNFGFDWYFTPGLSLGGKYTLGMTMNGQPEYTNTSGSQTITYKGPSTSSFGTGIASIMLNVHL